MKKNILFGILCFAAGIGVCVGASVIYNAKDIKYTTSYNTNITNVNDALDDILKTQSELGFHNKLSETSLGTATVTNNTHDTLYVALFSYTSNSDPSSVISQRTTIASITGAEYEELFYSFLSSTSYGIRVYKLTNCEATVNVTSGYNQDGEIIIFY